MPPPKPTRFCGYLRLICKECGEKHPTGGKAKKEKAHTCRKCGASMECGKPVVVGFSECQDHRGPNPYKGQFGMQSDLNKFPIVKLAQKYRKIIGDSRILSLRASIEVVRGRIEQLAQRIDFNDAPDRLAKIDGLWRDYMTAKEMDHRGSEMVVLEKQLTAQLDAAREDYAAWNQMLGALDLDRKLVDSEVKIVKELHAILTAEDAYNLVGKMLSIILNVYPNDPKKLRRVQYEFTKLVGDRPLELGEEESDEDVLDLDAESSEEA